MIGSSDDVFAIQMNAYAQFVADFGLKGSAKGCSQTRFDQLFIAVDSSNIRKNVEERYNRRNQLKCVDSPLGTRSVSLPHH